MAFLRICHMKNTLLLVTPVSKKIQHSYAAKKPIIGGSGNSFKAVAGAIEKKKVLPVETDPERLINYVCGSNIYKEGEDVKLQDDSEYPEWLWELRLGRHKPLEEYDPNTKEYWETLEFLQKVRRLRLLKSKSQVRMRVNEADKLYKLKQLRFRALAGYHYDPGYDKPPKHDSNRFLY